jgi:dolichyl-phosphate-mannose--protein O-mannosyl transferase
VLDRGDAGTLRTFPLALKEAWSYTADVYRHIPSLDVCNPRENGSPAYFWPVGARAIDYRWESDGHFSRYLYLQSNPVVWTIALVAVLSATIGLIRPAFMRPGRPSPRRELLVVFVTMYWTYLIGLSLMRRVLYLHSYFIALVVAFVIAAIVSADLADSLISRRGPRLMRSAAGVLVAVTVAAYAFFYPLTYYGLLTATQFERRALVKWWGLTCAGCPPQPRHGCDGRL